MRRTKEGIYLKTNEYDFLLEKVRNAAQIQIQVDRVFNELDILYCMAKAIKNKKL